MILFLVKGKHFYDTYTDKVNHTRVRVKNLWKIVLNLAVRLKKCRMKLGHFLVVKLS